MNRLKVLTGTVPMITNVNQFSESAGYDAHGNITSLVRRGKVSTYSYGVMDNLTLTYDGNQLTGVTETANDYNATGTFEYKRASGSEYLYDSNGSLLADRSRGIAYISYDSNGNPSRIYFMNGYMTTYTYSATGQKLAVEHSVALPNVTWAFGVKPDLSQHTAIFAGHTDYLLGGTLVVQEGTTKKLLFDGGYAKAERTSPTSTTYGYTLSYYNKDHLGNNRTVVSQNGAIEQITHYYPFGGIIADLSSGQDVQPYKYNGKELDLVHGLNTYDYGARQYYSILGRWDRMDPLCEKYYSLSPYNYCGNNPVKFIDINGDSIYYDCPTFEGNKISGYTRYTYNKYGNEYGFGRNGQLYCGENGTIKSIANALNRISSGGSYGAGLVGSLSGSSRLDVIIGYGYNATSYNTGSQFVKVNWDPDNNEGAGIDVNGNKNIEPFITLGHELIHAKNYVDNSIDNRIWYESTNGPQIYEEHVTCVRENFLRAENGIPLRKYYAAYENSNIGYPPSIINNPRCLFNITRNKIW